ncbi:hypothetical protein [Kitasatospora sp. NPDC098663]|uniref:hypothetical protein n=1 Tax=Kitasatospora sp. NPDC098663 TaxID=3364096 RepID=UPI00380F60D8
MNRIPPTPEPTREERAAGLRATVPADGSIVWATVLCAPGTIEDVAAERDRAGSR